MHSSTIGRYTASRRCQNREAFCSMFASFESWRRGKEGDGVEDYQNDAPRKA